MKQAWKPVTLFAVLALVAGCAAPQAPLTHDEFWTALTLEGLEVDPPGDLQDLVDDSEIIVVGKIREVLRGPVEEGGYDEYAPIAQLNVHVDQVLVGEAAHGEILKVIVARQGAVPVEDLAASIPTESLTFFLEDAGVLDFLSPTYRVGIVEEKADGSLSTVRDHAQTEAILGEAKTQADLVEDIKVAAK